MKQIEIKTHETIKATEEEKLTYLHLIEYALASRPMQGYSDEDDAERTRIEKVIERLPKDSTFLNLEDNDHAVLLKIVESMGKAATGWTFRSKGFTTQFKEDLKAAKNVIPLTVEELKPSVNGVKETELIK